MTALLGVTVVRDLSAPLMGPRDTNQWEYLGFYVSENFRWTPLPHLELDTDQVFYPYGVNSVFQSWGLERDLLLAACLRAFGDGPWLRGYYLASLLVGCLGAYLLLLRDVGHPRAVLASTLANLFNFYTLNKFPYHLNIAVVHWLTLAVIVDFLIARRIVDRRPPGLRLWLLRVCLTVLALGLDLAYVAAFSLLSLSVTLAFVVTVSTTRHLRSRHPSPKPSLPACLQGVRRDFHSHRATCRLLLAVTAIFSWLYVPPIVGILNAATSFTGEEELLAADRRVIMAASPLRLALPYLPGFNPRSPGIAFGDQPEGVGAGTVGWTLLLATVAGAWGSLRERRGLHLVPLALLALLLVLYSPMLPTLKLVPWTRFTRIASRTTLLLPILCALASTGIAWQRPAPIRRALLIAALVVLGMLELRVAYGLEHGRHRVHRPSADFLAYMEHVRQQPGAAVLDWPFCVVAGNGVGSASLCPRYEATHMVSSTRRFHRKKVVGHYFGRLRQAQIAPFLEAGWPGLLATIDRRSCFSEEQWRLFTEFFDSHDFAGLQLYTDLLPAACVEAFHQRFGRPTASTRLWATGRVEFIPRTLSPSARAPEPTQVASSKRPNRR